MLKTKDVVNKVLKVVNVKLNTRIETTQTDLLHSAIWDYHLNIRIKTYTRAYYLSQATNKQYTENCLLREA